MAVAVDTITIPVTEVVAGDQVPSFDSTSVCTVLDTTDEGDGNIRLACKSDTGELFTMGIARTSRLRVLVEREEEAYDEEEPGDPDGDRDGRIARELGA